MYIRMSFGHVLLVGFCGKRRAEKVRDERRGEGGGRGINGFCRVGEKK